MKIASLTVYSEDILGDGVIISILTFAVVPVCALGQHRWHGRFGANTWRALRTRRCSQVCACLACKIDHVCWHAFSPRLQRLRCNSLFELSTKRGNLCAWGSLIPYRLVFQTFIMCASAF